MDDLNTILFPVRALAFHEFWLTFPKPPILNGIKTTFIFNRSLMLIRVSFSRQCLPIVYQWGLNDSKSYENSGLFSVLWLIVIMLYSGRSLLVLWYQMLPVSLPIVKRFFKAKYLLTVSTSLLCPIDYFWFRLLFIFLLSLLFTYKFFTSV